MKQFSTTVLAAGNFFGEFARKVEVEGFVLGLWRACADTAVEPHGHENAHFMFVNRAAFVTAVKGAQSASPSLLIYNPPQTFHDDHFTAGRNNFFSVSIAGQAACMGGEAGLPDASAQVTSPVAHTICAKLIKECIFWAEDSPLAVEALCLELLGAVAHCSEYEKARPRWLDRAVRMLCGDLATPPSIADVSRDAGVTPIHLGRTFRRFFGCTPGEYVRAARLKRAAGLLSNTSLPLAEVALESGFADQSHFTHRFCAAFGVPPGKFRECVARYYI